MVSVSAESPGAHLSGTVTDHLGTQVVGAAVFLYPPEMRTATDADGYYRIKARDAASRWESAWTAKWLAGGAVEEGVDLITADLRAPAITDVYPANGGLLVVGEPWGEYDWETGRWIYYGGVRVTPPSTGT